MKNDQKAAVHIRENTLASASKGDGRVSATQIRLLRPDEWPINKDIAWYLSAGPVTVPTRHRESNKDGLRVGRAGRTWHRDW